MYTYIRIVICTDVNLRWDRMSISEAEWSNWNGATIKI